MGFGGIIRKIFGKKEEKEKTSSSPQKSIVETIKKEYKSKTIEDFLGYEEQELIERFGKVCKGYLEKKKEYEDPFRLLFFTLLFKKGGVYAGRREGRRGLYIDDRVVNEIFEAVSKAANIDPKTIEELKRNWRKKFNDWVSNVYAAGDAYTIKLWQLVGYSEKVREGRGEGYVPPLKEITTVEGLAKQYKGGVLEDIEDLIKVDTDYLKEKFRAVGEKYIKENKKEYGDLFFKLLFTLAFKEGGVYFEKKGKETYIYVSKDTFNSLANMIKDIYKEKPESAAEKWRGTLVNWIRNMYAIGGLEYAKLRELINYSTKKREEQSKKTYTTASVLILLTFVLFFLLPKGTTGFVIFSPITLSLLGLLIIVLLFLLFTKKRWFI